MGDAADDAERAAWDEREEEGERLMNVNERETEGEVQTIEAEVVEELGHLPAIRAAEAMVTRGEVSVDEIVAQHAKIVAVMNAVMTPGVHYGKIPGISKPTLLKAGAEVLNVALRLAPDYESEKIFDGPHLTVTSKCVLRHIPTGLIVASGEGLCSTRESKYAFRNDKRQCPACGARAIIKGKAEYGGGFVCWKKEGGCGTNFKDDDAAIVSQAEGKIENPDLPDTWNTVLKMADKRALVAAVLNGTAASDVFTQDAEDMQGSAQPAANDTPRAEAAETSTPTAAASSGYPLPSSWPKVEEAIRAYGDETWQDWLVFSSQARAVLFSDSELDRDMKAELRKLSAHAAKLLRDSVSSGDFPGPKRDDLIVAWQSAMRELVDDGALELAGPEWRMSPDEDDRPVRSAEDA